MNIAVAVRLVATRAENPRPDDEGQENAALSVTWNEPQWSIQARIRSADITQVIAETADALSGKSSLPLRIWPIVSLIAVAWTACGWTNTNLVKRTPQKLSDSRRTMAPDGRPAWAIACTRSMSECYDECARVCPYGYDIIDRDQEEYQTRAHVVAGDGWANGRSHTGMTRMAMLIACHSGGQTGAGSDDEDPPVNQRPEGTAL